MSDSPKLNQAIAEQLTRVETTLCLSTKVIVITEDQLELRVQDGMQKLSTRDSWIAPLSILLTCLATLFTADFKNFPWVASGTLKGLFIFATVASSVWLVVALLQIKKFGRREFMASVRSAGSPFNATVATASSQGRVPQDDFASGSLQCRQCGSLLLEDGQIVARCPNCGTVN
jgi:hypothetical protein